MTALCGVLAASCGWLAYDPFGVSVSRRGSVPATCANDRLDGDESDTDCGGSCGLCANERACRTAGDCASRRCDAERCAAVEGCVSQGAALCEGRCGETLDNCGAPLQCGGCTAPATCGGGGAPSVCGCSGDGCGTCERKCTGRECGDDGCNGSCGACDRPPVAACDGATLVTFGAGSCAASGRCEYASTRTPCPDECRDGRCVGCGAGQRDCGGSCVTCPAGPGIASTRCDGTRCVAAGCAAGYEACAGGCCRWQVETIDDALSAAELVVDSHGVVHVAYVKNVMGAPFVHCARREPSGWTKEKVAQHGGGFFSLVLQQDEPAVVFESPASPVTHAWRESGTWKTFDVEGMMSGEKAATDPDGTVYIAGTAQPERSRSVYLSVGWYDATTGSVQFIESVTSRIAEVDFAVAGYLGGLVWVERSDPANQWVNGGLNLETGVAKQLSFGQEIVGDGSASSSIGDKFGRTAVAFDADGRWKVAFVRTDQRKLLLLAEGGSATPAELVGGRDVNQLRLLVAPDGTLHALYAERSGALRLLRGKAAPWVDEAVTEASGVAAPPALALDQAGRPVVAWVDSVAKKLKVRSYGP